MIVKIRFHHGPVIVQSKRPVQPETPPLEQVVTPAGGEVMAAVAAILSPAAFLACAFALWRLGADMRMTAQFAIHEGIFSHWQVWFTLAGGLQLTAYLLDRRSKSGRATN